MNSPRVSVVMPVYNRLAYLREAVLSVQQQTFPDWELLIADDGSEGETAAYLDTLEELPRTRVVHLEHSGRPAIARNAAITHAHGEFVAFLDSDDLWLPRKLEMQLASLRTQPDRRWCYTAFTRVDANGVVLAEEHRRPWLPCEGDIFVALVKTTASLRTPSVMIERRLLETVGGFDETLRSAEDYDLWMRVALESEIALVNEALVYVRQNAGSYSNLRPGAAHMARDRSLQKMMEQAPPHWRPLLGHERASNSVRCAATLAGSATRTDLAEWVRASLPYSWRYAHWWWGVAKTTLRHLPRLLADAKRHAVASRKGAGL